LALAAAGSRTGRRPPGVLWSLLPSPRDQDPAGVPALARDLGAEKALLGVSSCGILPLSSIAVPHGARKREVGGRFPTRTTPGPPSSRVAFSVPFHAAEPATPALGFFCTVQTREASKRLPVHCTLLPPVRDERGGYKPVTGDCNFDLARCFATGRGDGITKKKVREMGLMARSLSRVRR
jgi:hypothetical protein